MENILINAINKVNELNYLSNDYLLSDNEFRVIIEKYKQDKKVLIDKTIEDFIVYVNGKMFYDWVVFKTVDQVPVLEDNISDVGLFYSLKKGMQYYSFGTMQSNNDIIRETDFLLAESTPGDFLVISFHEKDYGKLYYISHDFYEGEKSRFLAANSIKDFIDRMYVKVED